jgi:PEP-CTERM motif
MQSFSRFVGATCAALALAAALVATPVRTASAAPVVDQSDFVGTGFTDYFCGGSCNWYENLTAGVTGQLVGLNLWLVGGQVSVFGNPAPSTGPALFTSGPLPAASEFTATYVDLTSAGIMLAAGQQFSIDVFGTTTLAGYYPTPGVDTYLAGYSGSTPVYFDSIEHIAYQTFMDASPSSGVPAPGALALLGLGLAGIGGLRRRKAA